MGGYLVTGAAGGMGKAIADTLIGAGHEVWGIDRKQMAEKPGFHPVIADLCDITEVENARDTIRREAEALDGVIHTAGVYDLDSLAEMPEENFIRDFNINVFAAYRVNKTFLPLLKAKGRIVIITNELAMQHPLPFTGIYGITKTALDQYAAALRMELQLLGHPVIVIRPGAVRTGMIPESCRKLDVFYENTKLYHTNAERFRRIVNRVEARNIPPEKIAELILKALNARRPRIVYKINRNPMLILLNILPEGIQLRIIRKILMNG